MQKVSWKLVGFLLPLAVFLNSCTPDSFSASSDNTTTANPGITSTPTTAVNPPGSAVTCSPGLNGSSSSYTTTSPGGTNPTLTANCNPSSVTYAWTVTRGTTPVTINGLSGGSSTPDFVAAGPGTYSITLMASAVGYTTYQSSAPLTVVVNPATTLTSSVVCAPTVNGGTSVTLAGANPTVAANCNPANAGYVWTVMNGPNNVVVSGLMGSTSTPDFLSLAPGIYKIYLSATLAGYLTYTSTAPLVVTVPLVAPRPVDDTITMTGNKMLDVLLVIDDSSSMLADNQKLAARMKGFVDGLTAQGIDWQMCVTITQAQRISATDPNYYWGASTLWSGNPNTPAWILKPGTANVDQIFANTINAIGAGRAGSDDERGIKAAWWHLWNGDPSQPGNSGCYRMGAAISVVTISDEDERSVGGDQTQVYYADEANKPLEIDDLPSTYVTYVNDVFGANKQLTFNSIIVRPGDTCCMSQEDATGSKSHYGVHYAQLSQLTNGTVANICDADYGNNLNYFKNTIMSSQASITLQCVPLGGNISRVINPAFLTTASLVNNTLLFSPPIPAGSTVELTYTCPH